MTILLVNDDGYEAVGIKALESVLSRYGHEIWVSAPKTQMSGMSHAMTIGRPMKISRFEENHYFMDGTPVDCILYAKRYEEGLFPHDPDLVISGINNGYNLATDITYSGTCGAAREAVLCSWKAIAVSSEGYDAYKAAEFLASNLERLYSTLDLQSFLNINFPPSFSGAARLTIPGEVRYLDKVILSEKRGDSDIVKIEDVIREDIHVDGYLNDMEACNEGYASISSVSILHYSNPAGFHRLKEVL